MKRPSHIDEKGNARMVDVSMKDESLRIASASGRISMKPETLKAITEGGVPKGDVFGTARIAGIMAAKKTPDLIPLCHPLRLSQVKVDFETVSDREVKVRSTVRTNDRTGVEIEALVVVAVASLTVYDMCKSLDRGIEISKIVLEEKKGGKSGEYKRKG